MQQKQPLETAFHDESLLLRLNHDGLHPYFLFQAYRSSMIKRLCSTNMNQPQQSSGAQTEQGLWMQLITCSKALKSHLLSSEQLSNLNSTECHDGLMLNGSMQLIYSEVQRNKQSGSAPSPTVDHHCTTTWKAEEGPADWQPKAEQIQRVAWQVAALPRTSSPSSFVPWRIYRRCFGAQIKTGQRTEHQADQPST